MSLADFLTVFEPTAIIWSIMAGVVLGSTLLLRWSLEGTSHPTRLRLFALTTGLLSVLALPFFAGLFVQVYPNEVLMSRAIARYALWLLFTGSAGLGLVTTRLFAGLHR